MKDVKHRAAPRTPWVGICRSKLLALLCLSSLSVGSAGQACDWGLSPFQHGERVNYDVYYKWGLIASKAGSASFEVRDTVRNSERAWRYHLLFRSSGMLETFYKMRDTMTTYFSPDNSIIFAAKMTDEGGFYLLDELSFSRSGDRTSVRSYRRTRTAVRIDTTLRTDACAYDMLGAVMYLRAIDWDKLRPGDEFSFRVPVGKNFVNAAFRYAGPETVRLNDPARYRSHHFHIDVYDPAFSQSKEAAEVWVGDDGNHLPLRVRARLKVGAVEIYIRNPVNLRYPFGCKIETAK